MKPSFLALVALVALVALGALVTRDAAAAGTALDVQSGRGTGMAGATAAMIDDSSSIFYNPAGIARGKKIDAQIGITLIAPSFKYTNPTGGTTKLPFYLVPPPNAYVSGGITNDLSVGIGVFTPYGLKIKWPSGWEGRSIITEASLATYYVNPTVAYRFGPLRVGAGLQIVRATVELQRAIRFGVQEGSVDLGAGTWGVGANGGVQIDAVEKWLTVGVHYRSAVKLVFDGDAHFANVPPAFATAAHDQAVSTSIIQPDTLAMGIASRPIPKLVLDADIVWLGWSRFRSVDLRFPNDASGTLASSSPKSWHDTVNFHLGGEGTLTDNWRVRAGFLYDPSPSPSSTLTPDIPDANRLNLAIGGSYLHRSGVRIDLGYQFLFLFSKTSTAPQFPGEYGGNVNILGLSAGYTTTR